MTYQNRTDLSKTFETFQPSSRDSNSILPSIWSMDHFSQRIYHLFHPSSTHLHISTICIKIRSFLLGVNCLNIIKVFNFRNQLSQCSTNIGSQPVSIFCESAALGGEHNHLCRSVWHSQLMYYPFLITEFLKTRRPDTHKPRSCLARP